MLVLGTTGIASILSLSCANDDAIYGNPEWLLPAFSPEAIAALGAAYRRDVPSERSREALEAAIGRALREAKPWPWSPRPPLQRVVDAEFARGAVQLVDGWVLSATEARLCALVSAGASAPGAR
jgi:hypothetical protein